MPLLARADAMKPKTSKKNIVGEIAMTTLYGVTGGSHCDILKVKSFLRHAEHRFHAFEDIRVQMAGDTVAVAKIVLGRQLIVTDFT